ncbi:acetylcholine receptor subunit beta-like 1 [Dreissena polymorpha]|uniref:acetylcholine receptor subunit beta-like 1 n=1 Tax=Dreissena polymorpha TaxID=45954 RepID=UPI002264A69E|nr:acetylcholine receptor subunit beta-like 1 [Dreissena polymorpha]
MPCVFTGLVILNWICSATFVASETLDDAKNLIKKKFQTDGYSKTLRPLLDQTDVVEVYTDMVLTSIIEFNEQEESMKIGGMLHISWYDQLLTWNTSDYGGLDYLTLPQNDVWRPDVALHNSFKTFTGLGSSKLLLRVYYTGEVYWRPYQILEASCDVDITYFPFDTQECPFKFSAWSYFKDEVRMIEGKKGIYLDEFEENSRWSLVSTTAESGKGDASVLIYKIKLKRKSIFYVFYIIIPIHVKEPTHVRGHTLDVVITRDTVDTVSNVVVTDPGLSVGSGNISKDHYAVIFNARASKPAPTSY